MALVFCILLIMREIEVANRRDRQIRSARSVTLVECSSVRFANAVSRSNGKPGVGLFRRTFVRYRAQRVYQSAAAAGTAVERARRHGGKRLRHGAGCMTGECRRTLLRGIGEFLGASPAMSFWMPAAEMVFIWGVLARQVGFDAHGWIFRFPRWMRGAAVSRCGMDVANADRFVPYADASFSVSCRSLRG